MNQGDTKGQPRSQAVSRDPAMTSANALEQQRSRRHAVYGIQGVRGSNPSAPLTTTAQVAAQYCWSTSPPRAPHGRLRARVQTCLRDLGPPVGPELEEGVVDDLP
jgi:hypothetical protein